MRETINKKDKKNQVDVSDQYFNKNLSHFVKDFACRNEVIAKFNNKKSISQIVKEITFPISEESIVQMIWEYMIEKNIILLHEPSSSKNQQYDIVKKTSPLGKTHFEQVKKSNVNASDYEKIDIVKLRTDKEKLKQMSDFDRELIEKLPFENRDYYIKKS